MKNRNIFIIILTIIMIGLSGCGNQTSDKTIKLAFSKYDINEAFLFNEEIEEYANTYCEFYRNVISLYNHEITDGYSNNLDYYEEYQTSFDMYEKMQNLIDNMDSDESKEVAAKMQVNIASTNYLLTKINPNMNKESAQELYSDVVENYEYISDGE